MLYNFQVEQAQTQFSAGTPGPAKDPAGAWSWGAFVLPWCWSFAMRLPLMGALWLLALIIHIWFFVVPVPQVFLATSRAVDEHLNSMHEPADFELPALQAELAPKMNDAVAGVLGTYRFGLMLFTVVHVSSIFASIWYGAAGCRMAFKALGEPVWVDFAMLQRRWNAWGLGLIIMFVVLAFAYIAFSMVVGLANAKEFGL